LKLELAYFRELQAFAQFASDLDETTRKRIERGRIMVELLKQPNGAPETFYKQASVIYAGINGYLDMLPIEKLRLFEDTLNDKLDTSASSLAEEMKIKKELSKDIEDNLKELIHTVIKEIA